uniref:Kelch like family member 10 n=1 Tax=Myripristis murdjan TaxID=586833 RepID=A0A667ZST3_9TELE
LESHKENLSTGKLCDVVIRVDDVEFNIHKVVLCSCSPYFRALFDTCWTNPEKKVYNIPGLSSHMMHLIIEYVYTHSVPVTEENVEELLAAADQFAVEGVVDACCEFLEKQLCSENCIGIWKFVDIYYCPALRHKAYLFILHHFEEVATCEEFLQLSVEQVADIIQRDDLNVKHESSVFEAIVHWISHSPEDRKHHIAMLLSKVRLALMNAEYLLNNVKNHVLVKNNPGCRLIIINALTAMVDNSGSNLNYKNPVSCPRLPHAILLAIGGWCGGSATNVIEAYDSRADRWAILTNIWERPRAYHGTAFLNGMVYCIGGFDGNTRFNSVRKFDLGTRTWHEVAPMHSRRCYVSVAVLDGCIYAIGGSDGHRRLTTAERYEPQTNQWTWLASMHEQRSDASATTLHGKVFICGGFNGNECLATAECYDPETDQWTLIAPMRSRRSGVGVITYRGYIYAVGGFDGASRLQSVEVYNPVINVWRNAPAMFNPRSNFGIEVLDDMIFVVGGFNGFSTTFNVECYDYNTGDWLEVHEMRIFRSAVSSCVVHGLSNIAEYATSRDALALPSVDEDSDEDFYRSDESI